MSRFFMPLWWGSGLLAASLEKSRAVPKWLQKSPQEQCKAVLSFIKPHGKEGILSDRSWRTPARESSCRRQGRGKWGHLMPPFATGKETQHCLQHPCREGMPQAVLALCCATPGAGAGHGTSSLTVCALSCGAAAFHPLLTTGWSQGTECTCTERFILCVRQW